MEEEYFGRGVLGTGQCVAEGLGMVVSEGGA